MTQVEVDKVFEKWQELNVIYSTSDNRLFIREIEAVLHTEGKLDKGTNPLKNKKILQWYPNY